ncbi:hypothetical protein [Azospirillum thermophilum]|uniref:Uncharacterized protein n=1 Tax=Azospirillum thermophilum TaxID=2202148 RepID=A0A2S2D0N2_9PROT|nr:hypothetical protein [Azospirillum thermophilum]AWK90319.1 hypothetical protein DEW08_30350 [Azospirillum thermophilum]
MTADARKGFRAAVGRFRLALLLAPGLTDRDRRIGLVMLEQVNRQVWSTSETLVTWIGVDTLAAALGECKRNIQRARAALRSAGVLVACHAGGRGPGDTAQLAFDPGWLASTEAHMRAHGLLARLGYGAEPQEDDSVVALHRPVTLGANDKGDSLQGQGDTSVTHPAADPAQAAGKDDGSVALSAAAAGHPVDNAAVPAATGQERVTHQAEKGDRSHRFRVTGVSPEPCINPGINPAPARARRPARCGGPPPDQKSLMLPIPGGRQIGETVAAARQVADGKAEQRLDALLDRAAQLLGSRGNGALAVSTLQSTDPALYQGLLRGQAVPDQDLQQALQRSLDAFQGAGRVAAPTSLPPALSEAQVAAVVARVVAAMTPGIVQTTLDALRAQQGVAA